MGPVLFPGDFDGDGVGPHFSLTLSAPVVFFCVRFLLVV